MANNKDKMKLNYNSKIYVAGHTGMVGSAIVRRLELDGYNNILKRTSHELNLLNQSDTDNFISVERPDCVILAAAKVGGIGANIKQPAEFLMENLLIQNNVIYASWKYGVKKLIFLGSSCIYPKEARQPLKEDYLLSGKLESTNEGYAIAKIAGIKACEYYNMEHGCDFVSVMPPNLYGPNDNFDLENSHIVAALIRKMHHAKLTNAPYVEIWGTGKQYRELMHVDDLADAILFIMGNYHESKFINIGTGKDATIKEIAETIKQIIGYKGDLLFDETKPDGMHKKVLDVGHINKLGWRSKISFEDGIRSTYKWYVEQLKKNKNQE